MTLNDFLIFKPARNYDGDRITVRGTSTIVREMSDNKYTTSSTEDDVDINIADSNGNATRVDCIALKVVDADMYSITPTGGSGSGFTNRAIPTDYTTADGRTQTSTIDGRTNEIYLLSTHFTATSVRLQVSGTGARVYAVMLLELITSIPDPEFASVVPFKVDRTGIVREDDDDGTVDRVSTLGSERWKWETDYNLKVMAGNSQENVDAFLRTLREYPDIVHIPEGNRYPDRWYPASQTLLAKPTPLRNARLKINGYLVPFQVSEH